MADESKEESKGGSSAIIFIVIGVVLLLFILIGVVAFVFLTGGSGEHEAANSHNKAANLSPEAQLLLQDSSLRNPVAIYPLEDNITVNLRSPNPDDVTRGGYILFKVTLILADKNVANEITVKKDIISSILISTVAGYTSESLQTSQGVQKLKSDMVNSINAILQDGRIATLVFPKFTLQP